MDSCQAGDTLTQGPSLPVHVLTQGASFPARSSVPTAPAPWMLFKVTDRPPAVSGLGIPASPKAPGRWSAQIHPTPPESHSPTHPAWPAAILPHTLELLTSTPRPRAGFSSAGQRDQPNRPEGAARLWGSTRFFSQDVWRDWELVKTQFSLILPLSELSFSVCKIGVNNPYSSIKTADTVERTWLLSWTDLSVATGVTICETNHLCSPDACVSSSVKQACGICLEEL